MLDGSTVARFIKRPTDNAGIIVFPESYTGDLIKDHTVYEVKEFLGVLTISEVGESHMDKVRWAHEIQQVMSRYYPLFTKEEFMQIFYPNEDKLDEAG